MRLFGYPSSRFALLGREAVVIAIAALGGALFATLGMPAAWLSGSMLLSTIVSLIRPLPALRRPWFDSTMLFSGTILGSAATPEALAALARYPASLAVLLVGVAAIMLATGAYLRHVARWPWIDALLAAAPGALSTVLAIAQAKGANIGRISVVQLFRLLVLVAFLPSLMQATGTSAGAPAPVLTAVGPSTMLGLVMAGLLLGLSFERIGLAAPLMFGATFAACSRWRSAASPSRWASPSSSPGRRPGWRECLMPAAWRLSHRAGSRPWRCSPSPWGSTRFMSAPTIWCGSW
jgi:membrane AbrB-like protein